MQLSEKLRFLSSRYQLTQEDLGAQLGIAHTTVGRWLAAKSRPYDRHALKLAEIFGLTPEELIDDSMELPARLLEAPGAALRDAATRAKALFPDDMVAGQQAFEASLNHTLWKRTSLETAETLRKQAAVLMSLAEKLEAPFGEAKKDSIDAELDQLTAEAEASLAARAKGKPRAVGGAGPA